MRERRVMSFDFSMRMMRYWRKVLRSSVDMVVILSLTMVMVTMRAWTTFWWICLGTVDWPRYWSSIICWTAWTCSERRPFMTSMRDGRNWSRTSRCSRETWSRMRTEPMSDSTDSWRFCEFSMTRKTYW